MMSRPLLSLCVIASAALIIALSTYAADRPLTPAQKQLLGKEVATIFQNKCAACHDADTAKKGEQTKEKQRGVKKIDYILDLPRVAKSLVKGTNPEDSDLWYEVNEENMPPKDSGIKPLDKKEKAIVERWIREGAPAGPGARK